MIVKHAALDEHRNDDEMMSRGVIKIFEGCQPNLYNKYEPYLGQKKLFLRNRKSARDGNSISHTTRLSFQLPYIYHNTIRPAQGTIRFNMFKLKF